MNLFKLIFSWQAFSVSLLSFIYGKKRESSEEDFFSHPVFISWGHWGLPCKRVSRNCFNWKISRRKEKHFYCVIFMERNSNCWSQKVSTVLYFWKMVSIFSHKTNFWIQCVNEAFLVINVELFVKSIANILMLFLYHKTLSQLGYRYNRYYSI